MTGPNASSGSVRAAQMGLTDHVDLTRPQAGFIDRLADEYACVRVSRLDCGEVLVEGWPASCTPDGSAPQGAPEARYRLDSYGVPVPAEPSP